MRNIFIAITILCSATVSIAQSGKLKKADNLYSKVSYAEAAELYTELIGSTVDSPELKSKLADCFYQIGETDKSEEIYTALVQTGQHSSTDTYQYAQALKENGKYLESDKWMDKFYSMTQVDSRGKEFVENKSYLEEIKARGEHFSIQHLSINTEYADFGGYAMNASKVFFVSNRKKRVVVQRFHSMNRKKFLDLYSAEVNGAELSNPTYQSRKTNKKYHEGPLCFSQNYKKVFFTRNNMSKGAKRRDAKGIQNLKIYAADVDENGKWINETELGINSKEYSVGHPCISSDGKTMFFSSDMPGGIGGADIYKMEIKEDGSFGSPQNLGSKINTEGQEMFPWISNEGLLFFSSDGHIGLGGLDVFVTLPKKEGGFDKLLNVGKPINTSKDDFGLVMNTDNLTGYFSSNRETGKGDDDIYSFNLLKPFKVDLMLNGIISDVRSKEILPGAKVVLLGQNEEVLATTIADDEGKYSFGLDPELKYTVRAENENYFVNQASISTIDLPSDVETLEKDVQLEKDPGLSLYALITDAKTKTPLDSVIITIVDNMTGEKVQYMTGTTGDYLRPLADKKLDDRGSYNFSLSREGYLPKIVTYNTLFDKEGQYDVHSEMDLSMDPMVEDLRDLIEINPINFDLGKWNIRKDAKIELDKIVEVMNKYPDMVVELGSHTDCRASKAFNRKLSDKRAKSSASYIKSLITKPERIYGKGYGESKLLNGCECEGSVKSDCSEEEHEKNRRTEFKVISVGNDKVDVNNNSSDSFD